MVKLKQTGRDPGEDSMSRDIKQMSRVELESELVAERAAARRSNMIIVMMTVLAVLGFMVMAGTLAPLAG